MRYKRLICVPWVLYGLVQFTVAARAATEPVRFNRDIRPIMSDTCFLCHGPDKNARKAKLRMDIREEAIAKGAIVPGKPEQSEAIKRLFSTDADEQMPPPKSHKTITPTQKELFKRWVAEGAVYEGHWSYMPLSRPAVPELKKSKAPIRNPIDNFIQARLQKEGLQPSREADARTLIRRLALDLQGIPPTIDEVDAFVRDHSDKAYERIVDRYLSSKRFAERQTMLWLDAVRYADTSGFHGDQPYPVWPYRDYVINSFDQNKPFDEFTREQLAGDLLPNSTSLQKTASAYNRLNRVSTEGGLQDKEYLAKYAADRARTVGVVWMGATIGCAECHDHKFDPFTSRDFYSMEAFFADIKDRGLYAGFGNGDWGPSLRLASPSQQDELDALDKKIASLKSTLPIVPDDQTAIDLIDWETQLISLEKSGKLKWTNQHPVEAKSLNGATLRVYNDEPVVLTSFDLPTVSTHTTEKPGDGMIIASGKNPDNETYIVSFKPGPGTWTGMSIEILQDESQPGNRIARGGTTFVLTEIELDARSRANSPSKRQEFSRAIPDGYGQGDTYPAMAAIDGNPATGWGCEFGHSQDHRLALWLAKPMMTTDDTQLTVKLRHDSEVRRATIGRFRIALSDVATPWATKTPSTIPDDVIKAIKVASEKRDAKQNATIFDFYRKTALDFAPMQQELAVLERRRSLLLTDIPRVVITETTTPRETRILPRGNWMDNSGDIVSPAVPVSLGRIQNMDRRATRVDLAEWLVSDQNPLTARVIANRVWRQFFGTGLSKSLEDVGSQGEWPSHPELLDWLACEFKDPSSPSSPSPRGGVRGKEGESAKTHRWDFKHLIRTIVLSHTYRQSSVPRPDMQPKDPFNRLLTRQSQFRVDAEIVRDSVLAISGLLVEKVGGRSVRPFQPDGYWSPLNFPKREWVSDHGDDLYRRGLYTHWQRTFVHPEMLAFDAPTREECSVNRPTSNTPLQALVMLNDQTYVEAAAALAGLASMQAGERVNSKVDWIFLRALSRLPSKPEKKILETLYQKEFARFRQSPELIEALPGSGGKKETSGKAEMAALTVVARAILNLHETITRN